MPRSSGSIIGPRIDSQQNVFNVQYLGRSPMSNFSTGEGAIQSALFEMYIKFKTKKGTKKLSNAKIVLSNRGLSVVNWTNDEVFYSLSNVIICQAVIFTGAKTKVSGKKYYKFAFESLADVGRGTVMSTAMSKTSKYLLKMKHHPLVVCILRRELGPQILEIHAFVCNSNDQALGLSYSIEMARSVQLNEEKKNANVFNYDPYASPPERNQVPVVEFAAPDNQNNEADLPQVMNILKQLGGGRGSVVNQVVKTPNLNLMTDNIFVARNNVDVNKSQQNKMSVASRGQERQSRIYNLNQEDFVNPAQRPSTRSGHTRSSSFDHLNNISSFPQTSDFQFVQQPKASVKNSPQIQRSKSMKNYDQNLVQQGRTDLPQNFVSSNPSGGMSPGVDKPTKPVAMVQPRKISGIKVFPFGHDRTGLIPEKDKLRKKKAAEESKSSPTQTPEVVNLYAQVNKQANKNLRNTFIMKASTEEQLKKMMQDATLEIRK